MKKGLLKLTFFLLIFFGMSIILYGCNMQPNQETSKEQVQIENIPGGQTPEKPSIEESEFSVVLTDGENDTPQFVKENDVFVLQKREKEGHNFLGWEMDRVQYTPGTEITVTANMTFYAVYEKKSFAVLFLSDGMLLKEEKVLYLGAAIEPDSPIKEQTAEFTFLFVGWDSDFCEVTENLSINAVFQKTLRGYIVLFLSDGMLLKEEKVLYLGAAIEPDSPIKEQTAEFTFLFVGWDSDFCEVTENLSINAVFQSELRSYYVTILYEKNVILRKMVYYGEPIGKLLEEYNGSEIEGYFDKDGQKAPQSTLVYADITLSIRLAVPEEDVYAGTSGFAYAFDVMEFGYIISYYFGTDTDIVVPKRIKGIVGDLLVVGIGTSVFEYKTVTSIKLPEGLLYIDDFAFYSVRGLKEVLLPSTLTRIGILAFAETDVMIIATGGNIVTIDENYEITLFVHSSLYAMYTDRFLNCAVIILVQKTCANQMFWFTHAIQYGMVLNITIVWY